MSPRMRVSGFAGLGGAAADEARVAVLPLSSFEMKVSCEEGPRCMERRKRSATSSPMPRGRERRRWRRMAGGYAWG